MKRRATPTEKHRRQNHEDWKESLRQACFHRARKNRKDLIWKKRHSQEYATPDTIHDNNNNDNSNNSDVRTVVEQELRQQGVAVVTPGYYGKCSQNNNQTQEQSHRPLQGIVPQGKQSPELFSLIDRGGPIERQESYDSRTSKSDTEYVISEEELYELLQEVEEEMRRSEEELLEEVLEQERNEQQDFEQQIAEYEEWEETLASNHDLNDEECVICPICCESMLRQSPGHDRTIKCLNETCRFQLQQPGQGNQQFISLTELKERLRLAFEEHSFRCSGTLTFELQTGSESLIIGRGESSRLVGSCRECDASFDIT